MNWKVAKIKDASYMRFRIMDEKEMRGVALALDGKDAHLIAAAPTMLDVLKRIQLADNNKLNKQGKKINYHNKECNCELCAVIALAEGDVL